MKLITSLLLAAMTAPLFAQTEQSLDYKVEMSGTASNGDFAPLWLTANRFGMGSSESKSAYLKAGIEYNRQINRNWKLAAGLDLAGGKNLASDFWVQQAYADISWKALRLSIGSKERFGFPLEKNRLLTSGWMTEGPNARPIPQVRIDIENYLTVPFTGNWLALKGHLAYGAFMDSKWQENFAAANTMYAKNVLYHSKSLMFKLGNREKLPVEFEFGLIMATQFAGSQYKKLKDGSSELKTDMPSDLGAFWSAFFPTAGGSDTGWGEQVNVEGNMLGSWNFGLNYYCGDWKFRATLDHYFEDHSQMFWEYGRWKDGQLGIEITPPKNKWITSFLWEGISTYDSSGPILYDGFAGSFGDLQMSGGDTYYNHYIYQAWQHYGMGIGNPLLAGPAYNKDKSITFKSNRMKGHHIGITGDPSKEFNWRILASFTRHWGTYETPFDEIRKQFSSMAEVTYMPEWAKGWSATAAVAADHGKYLGNSTGFMFTLRKTGGILK